MTLSRQKVIWIVVLIVLALSGLVFVQTQLLLSAYKSKEQAFERNAMAALNSVTQKLAATEVYAIAFTADSLVVSDTLQAFWRVEVEATTRPDVSVERKDFKPGREGISPALWVEDTTVSFRVDKAQDVTLRLHDPMNGRDTVVFMGFCDAGVHSVPIPANVMPSGRSFWRMESDGHSMIMQLGNDNSRFRLIHDGPLTDKSMFVGSVLDRLRTAEEIPIKDRIDPQELDSVLMMTFREAGVELPFIHGVFADKTDSIRFAANHDYDSELKSSSLQTRLFPHDILAKPYNLSVYFPDRQSYLLGEMLPMVVPSGLLILIVVGCFVYTIRTILVQRRFGNLLVDFINNMTHEFKTPISTVQLAAEAIARDEVLGDQTRLLHFNQMILNESRRMKNQADKILQMAILEQGDYELKTEPIDIHETIKLISQGMSIHIESRGGQLTCELKASDATIEADPVHIANVINNIMDNAGKYSPDQPRIRVASRNANGSLIVSVADNGIGMSPEDVKLAFDKFFRVPQGNRHDVKGFGLGLSYVKLITEAHGGRVSIHSELGKGTRVDLTFPLASNKGQ